MFQRQVALENCLPLVGVSAFETGERLLILFVDEWAANLPYRPSPVSHLKAARRGIGVSKSLQVLIVRMRRDIGVESRCANR